MPAASRQRGVGWRGLPLHTITGADSGFRRTLCLHPRLRVSAGLNFAVILLSKAMDVGRDHLIHRKRSPFPYEGKALTLDKVGKISPIESNSSLLTPNYCPIFHPILRY